MSVVFVREKKNPKLAVTLFTNERVESAEHATEIAEAYRRRWVLEEVFRLVKQHWGLENLRALSLKGIRRTVMLALTAMGFLTQLRFGHKRLARALQNSSRGFGAVPDFCYYRLADAVGLALCPEELRRAA